MDSVRRFWKLSPFAMRSLSDVGPAFSLCYTHIWTWRERNQKTKNQKKSNLNNQIRKYTTTLDWSRSTTLDRDMTWSVLFVYNSKELCTWVCECALVFSSELYKAHFRDIFGTLGFA